MSPSPYLGIQSSGLISKTAEQPAALIGVHGNCWMFSAFEKSGHLCKQLIVAVRAQLRHLVLQGLDVTLPRKLSKPGIWLVLTADQSGVDAVCILGNSLRHTGIHPVHLFKTSQQSARAGAMGGQLLSVIWRHGSTRLQRLP